MGVGGLAASRDLKENIKLLSLFQSSIGQLLANLQSHWLTSLMAKQPLVHNFSQEFYLKTLFYANRSYVNQLYDT